VGPVGGSRFGRWNLAEFVLHSIPFASEARPWLGCSNPRPTGRRKLGPHDTLDSASCVSHHCPAAGRRAKQRLSFAGFKGCVEMQAVPLWCECPADLIRPGEHLHAIASMALPVATLGARCVSSSLFLGVNCDVRGRLGGSRGID